MNMKKKSYQRPDAGIVAIDGPRLMLQGSTTVNSYQQGNDIVVGDVDE